uniref:Reverse transcriptase domain-containing protein n=1 Tax=Tanacetum cinerariifolium TaxID=118510 RepID=A0A6L2J5M1_TANCI|nr:hypothetical protein [Tanacetum cinerariifolium]
MDPNTSIGRLCLGENNQGSVAERIKNNKQWEGPEFQDTTSSGKEKESKEERPVIETMAYSDKYKKILDGIVMDKIKLDGEIKKEEKEAIKQVKGEALQEKEDPEAFIIPIQLKAKIDINALTYTGSDVNVIPYRIYAKLGNLCKKEEGNGQWHAEIRLTDPYGNVYDQDWKVLNTLGCDNAIEDMLEVKVNEMGSDEVLFTSKAWKPVTNDELMTKKAIKSRLCGKAYAMSVLYFGKRLGQPPEWKNGYANVTWLIAKWMKKKGVGTHRESLTCCGQFVIRIAKRLELIGSNGRLISEEIAHSIPGVVTPRAQRPTTSDLFDKKSQLETRIGEIERMMRRQSYHSDRSVRVIEHIASHFRVTLRDPYDPPSYFKHHQQHDDEE